MQLKILAQMNPIHQWPFEESSGVVANDAVGSTPATLSNVSHVKPGAYSESAVRINGNNDSYISFGSSVGALRTKDFSLTFWIKTTDPLRLFDLIGNRQDASQGNFLSVRMTGNHESQPPGLITAELSQDGSGTNYVRVTSGTGGFNDGQWHSVAVVRQGRKLMLYVDGLLRESSTGQGVTDIAGSHDFRIGRSCQSNDDRFAPDAMFDDVRIYDVAIEPEAPALSSADLEQIITRNAPYIQFSPSESFLPCSVEWFLQNAWLCKKDGSKVQAAIDNLPTTGSDEGAYWLELKDNAARSGNLASAKAYIRAKLSSTSGFTDVSFWFCYSFNGAGVAKLFPFMDKIPLGRFGQHQGDWETCTLRINNLTKQVENVYLAQHDSGTWLPPSSFRKVNGRIVIYASFNGHASYPQPGPNPTKAYNISAPWPFSGDLFYFCLRNDCADGGPILDCAANYQIVSAPCIGGGIYKEPRWLDYPYRWGPRIDYPQDEIANFIQSVGVTRWLISRVTGWLEGDLPDEVKGENGPTGPKQKGSWFGQPQG